MNALIMNGRVVGSVKASQTREGAAKAVLTIETDGRDLPLRFHIVSFGNAAKAASQLIEGDEVLISGRMVASTVTKSMSIVANSIETFEFFNGEDHASIDSNENRAAEVPATSQQ